MLHACMAMCHDLLEAVNNEHLLKHILFSDEATFHTCGLVNRHNSRTWADEQPNIAMELERNTPKVNVWPGLTNSAFTVHSFLLKQQSRYHRTWTCLSNSCNPNCFPTTFWIRWCFNRTAPHRTLRTFLCNYLNETFPGRWIGRSSPRFWAVRSPDLTPLDFFAWGHIKTQVYKVKIRESQHLRDRISAAVRTITPAMLQRVFRCTEERWQLCWIWWAIMSNGSDFI